MSKESKDSSVDSLPSATPKESTFAIRQKLKLLDGAKRLEFIINHINERDVSAWIELINLTQTSERLNTGSTAEDLRGLFKKFLELYPRNGDVYLSYINFENSKGDTKKVEELYGKCLGKCYNLRLWKSYLDYIRKQHDIIIGGEDARKIVEEGYELALRSIGMDMDSSAIWFDYIKFIDEWNPISKWEESRKIEAKRKAFKQAVVIPSEKIEELWSMYTNFENELGQPVSRRHITDLSPQYMLARTWYKEYSNIARVLNSFGRNEHLSLRSHKVWINLEKQNKLRITARRILNRRIEFAYLKTLQNFPSYADIWFEYAMFKLSENLDAPPVVSPLNSSGVTTYKPEINSFSNFRTENLSTGIEILKEGLLHCSCSPLLTYLLSELYELKNEPEKISTAFDSLLNTLIDKYDQLVVDEEFMKSEMKKPLEADLRDKIVINRKRKLEDDDAEEGIIRSKLLNPDNYSELDNNDEEIKEIRKTLSNPSMFLTDAAFNKFKEYLGNIEKNKLKVERLVTSVYINYIKLSKRAVKKSVSRNIFRDARRRFKNLTWHLYYEEALFEYNTASKSSTGANTSGTNIALKIFDTGIKNLDFTKPQNFPYFTEYFKFVIGVNDYTNIKSLFETFIKYLEVQESEPSGQYGTSQQNLESPELIRLKKATLKELFDILLRYELYNGNILSIQNLQYRYKECFDNEADFHIYSQLFKEYNGLNLIREFDVDVNANTLFTAWTNYDTNVSELIYENVPSRANLYQVDYFSNPGYKEINRKIKAEYLIDNYDSYGEFTALEDESYGEKVGDTSSELDLLNYGLRSRTQAYKSAKVAEAVNTAEPRRLPLKVSVNNPVPDDDYEPLSSISQTTLFNGEESKTGDVQVDTSKPFVSDNIYNLLRDLPSSDSFDKSPFNSEKVVAMLQQTKIA